MRFFTFTLLAIGVVAHATPVEISGWANLYSDFPDARTYFDVSVWGQDLSIDVQSGTSTNGSFSGASLGFIGGNTGWHLARIGDISSSYFNYSFGDFPGGFLNLFDSGHNALAHADLVPVALVYEPRIVHGPDWDQHVTIVANPEPSTMILAGLGCAVVFFVRRVRGSAVTMERCNPQNAISGSRAISAAMFCRAKRT